MANPVSMAYARSQLVGSLRQLGLRPGAIVMVHASVRSVGKLHGGPDEIHLAVEEAVAPGGTVMMYVGCPDGVDDIGRGVYTPEEEAEIVAHQPAFDAQTARANRNFGILAEFFRSFPGTICSANAGGRMAARGARAAWLTADQPWDYAYGRGSPLQKLCEAGGKVLLLGSDHDEVTLLHYAEHVAEFEGKRVARYRVPVMRDGKRTWLACEEFDTSGEGVHPNWPDRFFALIVDDFIARYAGTESCSRGMVGNSTSVLMDTGRLVAHAADHGQPGAGRALFWCLSKLCGREQPCNCDVIPAKAGIQGNCTSLALDPRFRGGDIQNAMGSKRSCLGSPWRGATD